MQCKQTPPIHQTLLGRQKGSRGAIGFLQCGRVSDTWKFLTNLILSNIFCQGKSPSLNTAQSRNHIAIRTNSVGTTDKLMPRNLHLESPCEGANRAVKERFLSLSYATSPRGKVVREAAERAEWKWNGGRRRIIRSGAMGIFPNEDKK